MDRKLCRVCWEVNYNIWNNIKPGINICMILIAIGGFAALSIIINDLIIRSLIGTLDGFSTTIAMLAFVIESIIVIMVCYYVNEICKKYETISYSEIQTV